MDYLSVISNSVKTIAIVKSSVGLSFEEKFMLEKLIGEKYEFYYGVGKLSNETFFNKNEIQLLYFTSKDIDELFTGLREKYQSEFNINKSKYYKYNINN